MIWKILNLLDNVKQTGKERYLASCPAHEDSDPSLALTELHDGRILIHCFAGCEPQEILGSVGLTMSDLFPEGGLGEFKGWDQLKREQEARRQRKTQEAVCSDEIFLEVCQGARKSGERLNHKDLEKERQAYIRVRNANTNG